MESSLSHLPGFVREQTESAADPVFNAQLVEIAQRFASQKKRVIFISRAWPYEDDRLGVKEEWSVPFVDVFYEHLQLLGFEVIVDKRDLGVGVQLDDAMKTSVDKADHALLLVTRTYIHKATKVPTSGVAREVHYITHKVEAMDPEGINGWVIAGKRRFVLPLAFNDTRGFPLADSHPGIATIYVQNAGYREALIDLATKVYGVEPALLREIIPSHANILIQAVKKCYQEKKYIPRPFHDEPLPIEKGFVRLAIVKETEQQEKMKNFSGQEDESKSDRNNVKLFEDKRLTSFEQIYGAKEPIEIKDIFKPEKDGSDKEKTPKRLLVLGRAGIGKSILCQKMAHEWATSETEEKLWEECGQEKFKLVVWVPLRNLLDYPDNAALSDVILKECISKNHTGEKSISKDAVLRGLKELKPDEILYVCDGYDEVAGRTTPLIDEILAKENVFVTTRPHGINQYLTADRARPFDRKFESIGFLDEDIENYIRAFFGDQEESQNYAETLIQFLKAHPNVWGIAHIPINLMLICVAWKDSFIQLNIRNIKNMTITDLYCSLFVNLGRRYLDKHKVKGLNDFTSEDILEHEKCKSVLAVLSELAFQQIDNESLLIPGKSLTKTKLLKQYPDTPSLRDDVIYFGVLSPTSLKTNSEKTEFYFVHLTFQEFLAAFYIAENLRANDEEIKQYILRNKYSRRHEMVWWFVAGLLRDEVKVLEMFFDILESKPRDMFGLYHELLMMRCMDECQLQVEPMRSGAYLNNLSRLLIDCISQHKQIILYESLLKYLNISRIIFSESQILNTLCEYFDKSKFIPPVSFFLLEMSVPEALLDSITRFLFNKSYNIGRLRSDVIRELTWAHQVPVVIENEIASIFISSWSIGKASYIECCEETESYSYFGKKIVSSQVVARFKKMLNESDSSQKRAAIEFFHVRRDSLEEVDDQIAAMLTDMDKSIRVGAIEFFRSKGNFSEKILASIFNLLKDPDCYVKIAAINFFSKYQNASDEITKNVAIMLEGSDRGIKTAAVNFFATRQDVSDEITIKIASMLEEQGEDIKEAAVNFFSNAQKVSEKNQKMITSLLQDRSYSVRRAVKDFFGKRENISEEVQKCVAALFFSREELEREAAVEFFSELKNLSEKIQEGIVGLFADTSYRVKLSAVSFFRHYREVSDQTKKSIALLFTDSEKYIRVAAIDFFDKTQEASQEVQDAISALLVDPEEVVRVRAIKFFGDAQDISKKNQKDISILLADPAVSVRQAALEFFTKCQNVSEEFLKSVAVLLVDPDEKLRTGAVEFFSKRQKLSDDIKKSILALSMDECAEVRNAVIYFFDGCQQVSTEEVKSIAGLLADQELYVQKAAFNFFCDREEIPLMFLEMSGSLLKKLTEFDLEKLLEKISVSQIIQYFNRLDKRDISSEFLIVMVVKFAMLNIVMYQRSAVSIQIENFGKLEFNTEAELSIFSKKFKVIFREHVGINFIKSEELDDEEFSQGRAMSFLGHLRAPRESRYQTSPHSSDKAANKRCVIC